jgi:hypothetical protein
MHMRFRTWLFVASLAIACGPLPESTKVGPAGKRTADVDNANDVEQVDDGYYREGIFEVGLGRDYAVVNGHKVALTGSGGLADILKPVQYTSWRLSLRDDATGRDLITALKAGVEADFSKVKLSGAPALFRLVPGYSKPDWPKIYLPVPAITLNIAKTRVLVTQSATDAFNLSTEDIHSKFEDAFDKICKRDEYKCGNVIVTIDDDAEAQPIVDVITALGSRTAIALVTSTADLTNTLASGVQPTEVRQRPPEGSGRLPPEVIQKIVRENYGVFRACYEQGLLRDRDLQGAVVARFVIGRDGQVRNVAAMPREKRGASPRPDGLGTTMPDRKVVDCIINGYKSLEFPQPEGGIVTVVYPIRFSPG